jgi:hypothetical protein
MPQSSINTSKKSFSGISNLSTCQNISVLTQLFRWGFRNLGSLIFFKAGESS